MSAFVNDLIGLGIAPSAAKAIGHVRYAGNPTNNVVPFIVGQTCHDTTNDDWYIAHGVAAADWKIFAT